MTGEIIRLTSGGRFRFLPPYVRECVQVLRLRHQINSNSYDCLFAWELRTAVAVALCRKLSIQRPTQKRAKFVVLGMILKGHLRRVTPLLRWLFQDADRIICFSKGECTSYAAQLRFSHEQFRFVPSPWRVDEPVADLDGGFILALGHSARDYPTLIEAVTGTDLPLLIVAKSRGDFGSATNGRMPTHIHIWYNTESDETDALIASATFVVIPLKNVDHSAGQSVLLRSMARGKVVVVTDTSGIRDYVRGGETALLVPPGDVFALRAALLNLWNNASERQRIGKQAATMMREEFGFPVFARQIAAIAEDLLVEE